MFLAGLWRRCGAWFQRTGRPLLAPNHWFEDTIREAGIKDFTWHDCRHTFASRLVMKGVPFRAVADQTGHATIQMTMRYAHLAPANKLAAVRGTGFLCRGRVNWR
ncbi:MAG: tyrosine-type recombinase/integrase [Terriglobia bacterium]